MLSSAIIHDITMAFRLVLLALMGVYGARALYDAADDVLEVTDANFAAVKARESPLFLEFYAPWCGHCKQLAPKWKNVASELRGKVIVAAVNCDENRETCGQFGIQGFRRSSSSPEAANGPSTTMDRGRSRILSRSP